MLVLNLIIIKWLSSRQVFYAYIHVLGIYTYFIRIFIHIFIHIYMGMFLEDFCSWKFMKSHMEVQLRRDLLRCFCSTHIPFFTHAVATEFPPSPIPKLFLLIHHMQRKQCIPIIKCTESKRKRISNLLSSVRVTFIKLWKSHLGVSECHMLIL